MNKLINFVAEIVSVLVVSAVFLVVCYYLLKATHFFSAEQLENVTLCASLFVCFVGCVVVDKFKNAAQI
jgi:Kef-type K+ transport system membrane component KefB